MSKKTYGKKKAAPRARPSPYPVPDGIADMDFDTEDENYVPGVRDLLNSLRQFTPPAPASSSAVPVSGLNPLVMSMASTLESTDYGSIAHNNPEPLAGWSDLSLRLLNLISKALSDYKPGPSTSYHQRALVGVRMRLRMLTNTVDETADKLGVKLTHTCPSSCSASREGSPATAAAPPAPPAPPAKTYADVLVEARPPSPILSPSPPLPVRAAPAPRAPRKANKAQAPATATLPKPPASAGVPSRPKVLSPAVTDHARLVVRFGGKPPQDLHSRPQTDLFRRISSMLDVHPTIKGVTILGAHWNRSGNIIISFPNGTSQDALLALRPGIRAALGIADSVVISIDTPWSKLMVSSVLARPQTGAPVFSEADLAISYALNPEIKKVSMPRPPRWIRNPSNITGAHSSFVFCIEDPDGSIARRLLKTPLFMFGAPVSIKRWQVNPKPKKPRRPDPGPARTGPARDNDVNMSV